MKKNIKDITEVEIRCKTCKTKNTFDIKERKKSFSFCPNCGGGFFDDDTNLLNDFDEIFYRLNHIKNIEFSFICDDEKAER